MFCLSTGSPGPAGELAVVRPPGGRIDRRSFSLQSHYAHRATPMPGHGPATRGPRRQVGQRLFFLRTSLRRERVTECNCALCAGCYWTGRTRTTTRWADGIQRRSTFRCPLLLLLQLLHAHWPPTGSPVPQKQIPRTEVPPLPPRPLPPPRTSVRYC